LENQEKNETGRSWFCEFNNPEEHGISGTPEEIVEKVKEMWISAHPQGSCAVTYCISATGLKHLHAVFENVQPIRFSAIKKLFPSMNIQPTKGNKKQAEGYITKQPPYDEKGEQVLCIARHGEIEGKQGFRSDYGKIEELIGSGKTPNVIMDMSLSFRKHEKLIKDAFFRKRFKETPVKRFVTVNWHWGESGTGKSHMLVKLVKMWGEDEVYFVGEYEKGFDKYNGEKVLFLDEFRGQIKYPQLLLMLDGYKTQIHARYTNIISLWEDVHITSVYPPDIFYENLIKDYRQIETYEQIRRRIVNIYYHYKNESGEYKMYHMDMCDYRGHEHQKNMAQNKILTPQNEILIPLQSEIKSPFDV